MTIGLTDKQKQAYELKEQGKTYNEIAAALGCSHSVICKRLKMAYKKLGISKGYVGSKVMPSVRGVEHRDPETAAAMLDAVTDPLRKVVDALKAAGLPEQVSQAMVKRLRVKFYGAVHEVKQLKTQEILRMIEEKLDLCRHYLDDKVLAEASARDIMLGMGVLIEKRQLLRGEPTQIISDHERKKLNELTPLLIEEARRRGVTIEGAATVVKS